MVLQGYVAVPSTDTDDVDVGVGSSRHASASSSLSSSPLQHATAMLFPASVYQDEPYELSEKSTLPTRSGPKATTRGGECGYGEKSVVGSVVGWMHRCKTAVLGVCLVLALLVVLHDHTSSPSPSPSPSTSSSTTNLAVTSSTATPAPYRLEDDIVLITKVGSATLHQRLLIHLIQQPLSHIYTPNTLYVSDYPLTIGNITFYDALSNLSSTISALPDFRSLRDELHALLQNNQNLAEMSKDAGWKLDKYKFLPAVAEAWRRFPGRRWYVMVEADTFLFWDEMVKWLGGLDSGRQLMMGHASFCDYDGKSTMFAHGGSGIVLSYGLVKASFGKDADFEHSHDSLIQASAFGDALLSKSLYDTPGVNLKELSPEGEERFNSDPPRVLKFVKVNWCKPILTFHHITPTDATHLYDFQRRIQPLLPPNDTIRWSDIWDEFTPPLLKQAMHQLANPSPIAREEEQLPGEVCILGWQAFEDWEDRKSVV